MVQVVLTVLGMVAQMERRFIKERREGIARAKVVAVYKEGMRRLDRDRIRTLHGGGMPVTEIARQLHCSRTQVYRVLKE